MKIFNTLFRIVCYVSMAIGIYKPAINNMDSSIISYCIAILAEGFVLETEIEESRNK